MRVSQRHCAYADAVPPGSDVPYVWDMPLERRLVLSLAFGEDRAVTLKQARARNNPSPHHVRPDLRPNH